MTTGKVTPDGHEARIVLNIRGPTGRTAEVEVVVDTGFTDELSLRPEQIEELKLTWLGTVGATLADGRNTTAEIYIATVKWNADTKRIAVVSIDSVPLMGMKIMHDCRLTIDVIPNGDLRLESLSSSRSI